MIPTAPNGLAIFGTAEIIHATCPIKVIDGRVEWAGTTEALDQETVKNFRTGERIYLDSQRQPHKESDIDWKGLDINL